MIRGEITGENAADQVLLDCIREACKGRELNLSEAYMVHKGTQVRRWMNSNEWPPSAWSARSNHVGRDWVLINSPT